MLPELRKDPAWRERSRQKSKRINQKRKADPVRYAAFLAKRREYQRRWKQRRKARSAEG